jgi:Ca2+-binding EF-hand superfamily protein
MSKPPLPRPRSKPSIGNIPLIDNVSEEQDHNLKNMTLLGPDAIHWMNKRRPLNQTQAQPQHISPHRASQLRDMFDGLDFNGGGEIDLKEFKEAIAYVESRAVGGTSIFGDPKRVNEIFQEMDADGSGTVDFNEFVIALTSDTKSNTNSGNQLSQLQNTFYEFANMHRRQNILDKIETGNDDIQRYNEFEKLFRVEYFVEGFVFTSLTSLTSPHPSSSSSSPPLLLYSSRS